MEIYNTNRRTSYFAIYFVLKPLFYFFAFLFSGRPNDRLKKETKNYMKTKEKSTYFAVATMNYEFKKCHAIKPLNANTKCSTTVFQVFVQQATREKKKTPNVPYCLKNQPKHNEQMRKITIISLELCERINLFQW